MDKIALPKKVEFIKGKEPNQKQVVIEPLFPGYGITLGNSLRRVLLSSLPGSAVVGVKIKGADHEFMSLPHIKEDVLEMILNLKQLRLKVFSEETVKLELAVRGEKEVKAGDITKNSQVEIINPDMVIAHITDMAGSLEMEISASQGTGYETIESRESKKHEIGYIEMDSIFSPVIAVGIKVENMRVGKMTNWDKLILHITTDGTLTPEDGFNQTVNILISQFNALLNPPEEVKEEKPELAESDLKKEAVPEEKTETNGMEQSAEENKPKKRGRPRKVIA